MFDPNEYEPDANGGGDFNNLSKALKGAVHGIERVIEHGTTKRGKLFTKFRMVVIWAKDDTVIGASFLDRVYRSPSSYKALGGWCAALGIKENFNPEDNSDIERLFLGKAFWSSTRMKGVYAETAWRTGREEIRMSGAPHGRSPSGEEIRVPGDKVLAKMNEYEAGYELGDHQSSYSESSGAESGFPDDEDWDFGDS